MNTLICGNNSKMNILFSKFKTSTKVFFTRHVQERTLQRFKLYMTLTEQQNVLLFLRKDFAKAKINFANHMSPFYVNSQDSRYGKNSFVASSEYLNYYGNYDEKLNQLVIKTIIKKDRDVKK